MVSLSTTRETIALLILFAYSTRAQWANASAPDAPQWPSDYPEPDTDEAVSKLPALPLHRLGLAIDKDITMGDVLEQDEWRAQWLAAASFENETSTMDSSSSPYRNRRSQRRASTVGHYTMMNDVTLYAAEIGVGSPATKYQLIFDTGSANIWFADPDKRRQPYKKTRTSYRTGNHVKVRYMLGSFEGEEYIDKVALQSLAALQQPIAAAYKYDHIGRYDGVLGFGPTALSYGTTSGKTEVRTILETLVTQESIPSWSFGLAFSLAHPKEPSTGEVTFGGYNPAHFSGQLVFTPFTTDKYAYHYWAVDMRLSYGGKPLTSAPAVIDTGSTFILLEHSAYRRYQDMTKATVDPRNGLLRILPSMFGQLKPLKLSLSNGYDITISPNAQVWPKGANENVQGSKDWLYLVIGDMGESNAGRIGAILGHAFLQRFYTFIDVRGGRIGFATTKYSNARMH